VSKPEHVWIEQAGVVERSNTGHLRVRTDGSDHARVDGGPR
jgi:hypothetical protein